MRLPNTGFDAARAAGYRLDPRAQMEHLASTAQLAELAEHQPDRIADALVGVNLDVPEFIPAKARRQRKA